MVWRFGKRRRPPALVSCTSPPGEGWRNWFEISARAAHDPPWRYAEVEIWRANWERPRIVRAADIPYQQDGPGFWWRPLATDRRSCPQSTRR